MRGQTAYEGDLYVPIARRDTLEQRRFESQRDPLSRQPLTAKGLDEVGERRNHEIVA